MKGMFDPYVLWLFDKKLISWLVTHVKTLDYTVWVVEKRSSMALYSCLNVWIFQLWMTFRKVTRHINGSSCSKNTWWSINLSGSWDIFAVNKMGLVGSAKILLFLLGILTSFSNYEWFNDTYISISWKYRSSIKMRMFFQK